ncbi:unnamed protein product [Pylaiella littoralis]
MNSLFVRVIPPIDCCCCRKVRNIMLTHSIKLASLEPSPHPKYYSRVRLPFVDLYRQFYSSTTLLPLTSFVMFSGGLSLGGFTVPDGQGREFRFDQYNECSAVLIVNVASQCSSTERNYRELQGLRDSFDEDDLAIVAFPCNQFGQEPGSWEQICGFAESSFGVTFPILGRVCVNGLQSHPLFAWLKAASGNPGDISWNFTKFLVVGGDRVVRYSHEVSPSQMEHDIRSALAAVARL